MRDILYSPGFGAGWTTWHYGSQEAKRFMLTYEPFVAALKRGEKLTEPPHDWQEKNLPLDTVVAQFVDDFKAKFPNESLPYMGGLRDLETMTVHGEVKIEEYDGSESVLERGGDEDEWL
jgi:hypothetical protein